MMSKTALVLIDIQNDYFPQGKMVVEGCEQAALKAQELIRHFRKGSLPVIHVQHFSRRSGAGFLLAETRGAEIHELVKPVSGEPVVEKHYPNSFRETDLLRLLKDGGIDSLIFCGMMTHMCVDATVRAAFDYGFTCTVVHEACASRNMVFNGREIGAEQVHGAFMAALGAVYAKVCSVEELVAEMAVRN
jgi:nicotinamidase-related amidase